jgi:hypothetical protein
MERALVARDPQAALAAVVEAQRRQINAMAALVAALVRHHAGKGRDGL